MKKRVILGLLFAFAFQAHAGLKIYYIRHGTSGRSLLKLLLKKDSKGIVGFKNTGIWMVEQQEDGSYQL
ncbi:MAG: hypothetical protein VX704_07760, partial [Verrucomicrobiota bacterium]|nr:hypothetical protein [Verrucomicrobiota bacterium]